MPGTGSVVIFFDSLTILGVGPSIFVEVCYFLINLYPDMFINLDLLINLYFMFS